MEKTIIFYDSTGKIIFSASGDYIKPTGQVSTIETEIPDGYIAVKVENGAVVTEALPQTPEQQRLAALEAQMNALIGAETEEDTDTAGTDETEV